MAIAKNPRRHTKAADADRQAEAFISAAAPAEASENLKQMVIRIPPRMIPRIDRAAERLGISRSAFIVQSAARELERMEGREI